MYTKTEIVQGTGIRRKYKKVHYFNCDNCQTEFTKDTSSISTTRLNNNVRHYCGNCKSAISAYSGSKQKLKRQAKIGNKATTKHGYVEIFVGFTTSYSGVARGWMREHVKVMQDFLNRPLQTGEVVHHVDGDKKNNDISNLDLCLVQEHNNAHAKIEQLIFELLKQGKAGYDKTNKLYYLK